MKYLKIVMLTSPGFFFKEANLFILNLYQEVGQKPTRTYSPQKKSVNLCLQGSLVSP